MRVSLADVASCGPQPLNVSPQFPAWAACETAALAPAPPSAATTGNGCANGLIPYKGQCLAADAWLAAVNGGSAAAPPTAPAINPPVSLQVGTASIPASSNPQPGTVAATFPAVGYIDPQGNLWQLGASGQVGGTDTVNMGALNSSALTSTASQTLATALQGNTSTQNGYLLLNSTAMSAVESAYGIGGIAGMSSSTLLLIAAGAAAVFMATRH